MEIAFFEAAALCPLTFHMSKGLPSQLKHFIDTTNNFAKGGRLLAITLI